MSSDEDVKNGHATLSQMQSLTHTYTITPEQFEKLYLGPKTDVAGQLRKTFANPTPVAVMGFVMALSPLSIALMGWRGSGGGGVATTGGTIWFGGILLIIAGLLEFVLGNTFPSVVFLGYGAHFLTFATTFIPAFHAVSAFNTDGSQAQSPEFLASFGFYNLYMGLLSLVFLICSIRTNAVFVLIFTCAVLGFGMAAGGFWQLAQGNATLGLNLIIGVGGVFFAAAMLGWYMFLSIMLSIMDLPSLPVFDLSTRIRGVSERKATE